MQAHIGSDSSPYCSPESSPRSSPESRVQVLQVPGGELSNATCPRGHAHYVMQLALECQLKGQAKVNDVRPPLGSCMPLPRL